ncbi:MAG: DUF1508 domain-containing protein [Novosphingobium sp.]
MYFEKYQDASQWRWRLKAANHEIVASGEAYWNESGCDHAINLVKGTTARRRGQIGCGPQACYTCSR